MAFKCSIVHSRIRKMIIDDTHCETFLEKSVVPITCSSTFASAGCTHTSPLLQHAHFPATVFFCVPTTDQLFQCFCYLRRGVRKGSQPHSDSTHPQEHVWAEQDLFGHETHIPSLVSCSLYVLNQGCLGWWYRYSKVRYVCAKICWRAS